MSSQEIADSLIPTFVEVPYQTLVHRVDCGTTSLLQLSAFLNEKCNTTLEKDILFALKVSRSNTFNYEIEASTTERLLGFYKNYYINTYKVFKQQHQDYSDHILKQLEILKAKRAIKISNLKQIIQHDLKEVGLVKDSLEKAKKVLIKAKSDHHRATEKLANIERNLLEIQRLNEERLSANTGGMRESAKFMGRMFSAFESNPELDREKQVRKVEKRKNEVLLAKQNILDRKKDLLSAFAVLDEDYAKAALDFQELELERMHSVKTSLKTFCSLERQALENQLNFLHSLEEAVNLHQPEEDIELFISQAKHVEHTHKYSRALCLLEERLVSKALVEAEAMEKGNNNDADTDLDSNIGTVPEAVNAARYDEIHNEISHTNHADGSRHRLESIEADPLMSASLQNDISTQLESLIQRIFGEDRVSGSCPNDEEWSTVFAMKDSRDRFLMELDRRRGQSASLDHEAYESMVVAMHNFLGHCERTSDALSAMRISNMANTFHRLDVAEETDSGGESKHYLQGDPRLRDHSIWKQEGFWSSALRQSVLAELNRSPPIHWADLSPEELRETVIAVHNVIFGQLGSLSFVMQQQGLSSDEIIGHIKYLSQTSQLPEDLEYQLISTATGQKIKVYVPPPALATTADQTQPSSVLEQPTAAGLVLKVGDQEIINPPQPLSESDAEQPSAATGIYQPPQPSPPQRELKNEKEQQQPQQPPDAAVHQSYLQSFSSKLFSSGRSRSSQVLEKSRSTEQNQNDDFALL